MPCLAPIQPTFERGHVLADGFDMLGDELGVPVVDVFLVQVDGTAESALEQLPGVLRVDNSFSQRAILPLVVFPTATLGITSQRVCRDKEISRSPSGDYSSSFR